jgi:hypothetical protein
LFALNQALSCGKRADTVSVKRRDARFDAAVFSFMLLGLSACGGGGSSGQSAGGAVVPPVTATPVAGTPAGPVTYLQSNGPLSSSGSITPGAHQALVAVMSGSANSADTFSADTLTVATASSTQSVVRAQSAGRAVSTRQNAPVEAFAADDRALLRARASLAALSPSPATVRTQSVLPSALQIGSSASLWVQRGSLTSTSRTNVQVPSTLLSQTPHGNIWVDNSLLSGAASSPAFASGSLQATLVQISEDFENAYASDVAHFASPDFTSSAPGLQPQYKACSSSGASQGTSRGYIVEPADRRVNMLVVNAQNLGGLGGYFTGANYMTQTTLNCLNGSSTEYESNEAPFIFVGWFQNNGTTYELQEDLVRSTAHELQHLINFVNHAILASAASSSSYNGNETPYINEGLSMLAQDLAVDNMYGARGVHFDSDDALARASVYLSDPGSFSISGFGGIDPPAWGGNGSAQYNCGGGCYGGAYLFQRYLRDRFGGDAYTHAVETSGAVGSQNLQAVTASAPGALLDDFALAMAANTLGVTPTDARFSFGALNLMGTYPDQFGGSRALSGVYATPFSGTSISVNAPIGGFSYVSVPSVPSGGMPVEVTDRASVSGFGMAAGLAQH